MFKTTSENMQRRARFAKFKNKIDVTAFKTFNEMDLSRQELVAAKQEIEGDLGHINQQIKMAATAAKASGMYVRQAEWSRLHQERSELCKYKSNIDQSLTAIKLRRTGFHERDEQEFAETFLALAKIMLAKDVYLRVCAAAAHAIGEAIPDEHMNGE